ncbi:hypothetical protein TYRP_011841 [Tyrophagus putrescentiae]|nr:hypothetical protein TYRP_011841 [Tyrophagus putrescentiae]
MLCMFLPFRPCSVPYWLAGWLAIVSVFVALFVAPMHRQSLTAMETKTPNAAEQIEEIDQSSLHRRAFSSNLTEENVAKNVAKCGTLENQPSKY